jgi:hypothetical protein
MASHKEGCGFSSLMKQKIKAKNYAVICFAGKRKLLYLHLRCDYMGGEKKALLTTTKAVTLESGPKQDFRVTV